MAFDPNTVINQATSGPSIYSPLSGNPALSYQGTQFYGLPVANGPQNNSGGGFFGGNTSQYMPSPSNFTNFNPASSSGTGGGSSPLSHFNSPFSGLTTAINNFGAESLGFGFGGPAGTGALAAETISPGLLAADSSLAGLPVADAAGSLGAGSLTSASLSSTLGAAGIGAFAGGFLGKIGGNSTGGSIGGGIGAAIGNMILPGVGGIIGGLIGGIGGGFFGGKKGTSATMFGVGDISDWDNTIGYGGKNNNSGYNKTLASELKDYVDVMGTTLGGTKLKGSITGGYNSLHGGPGGGYIDISNADGNGAQRFNFSPDDKVGKKKAMTDALTFLARNNGATDAQVSQLFKSLDNPYGQGNAPLIAPPKQASGPSKFDEYVKKYVKEQHANAAPV